MTDEAPNPATTPGDYLAWALDHARRIRADGDVDYLALPADDVSGLRVAVDTLVARLGEVRDALSEVGAVDPLAQATDDPAQIIREAYGDPTPGPQAVWWRVRGDQIGVMVVPGDGSVFHYAKPYGLIMGSTASASYREVDPYQAKIMGALLELAQDELRRDIEESARRDRP